MAARSVAIADEVKLLDHVRVLVMVARDKGYRVTLVKDATAAFSPEAMHAAHAINGPTYAHAITTTAELIAELTGG